MKFNITNAKIASLSLALLMVDAGPVLAARIALNLNGGSGTSCDYTSIAPSSTGDLSVECAVSSAPAPTPTVAPTCLPTAEIANVPSSASTTLAITSGAPVMLRNGCNNSADQFVWTANPSITPQPTASVLTVNPTVTTTYSVKGHNTIGWSANDSRLVTVTVSDSPPAQPAPTSCTIVDVTWPAGLDTIVTPDHKLPGNKIIAFRQVLNSANNGIGGSFTDYGQGFKDMSISTTACEFSQALANKRCQVAGTPETKVNKITNGTTARGYCTLPPLFTNGQPTVIYYNVKNGNGTQNSENNTPCPSGDCKFKFAW